MVKILSLMLICRIYRWLSRVAGFHILLYVVAIMPLYFAFRVRLFLGRSIGIAG
jgi:hypothetical protein